MSDYIDDLADSLLKAAVATFPPDPCNPDDTETITGWELISTTEEARREEPNLPEMYAAPEMGSVEPMAAAIVATVLLHLAAYMGPRFNTISTADLRHLAATLVDEGDRHG